MTLIFHLFIRSSQPALHTLTFNFDAQRKHEEDSARLLGKNGIMPVLCRFPLQRDTRRHKMHAYIHHTLDI